MSTVRHRDMLESPQKVWELQKQELKTTLKSKAQ
jgi:hypothetical protein